MADIEADFETRENRLMRAWIHGDQSTLKSQIASDFIFMFGTTPPALLDRPSFMSAVGSGLRCTAFRFHEATARKHGKTVWFTGHVELELKVGMSDWSGRFLLTDLWRKGIARRGWKLAERSLSPLEPNEKLFDAVRSLQLWR